MLGPSAFVGRRWRYTWAFSPCCNSEQSMPGIWALAEAQSPFLYITACLYLSVMKVYSGCRPSLRQVLSSPKGKTALFFNAMSVSSWISFHPQAVLILVWRWNASVLAQPSSPFMSLTTCVEYVLFVLQCSTILSHREWTQLPYFIYVSRWEPAYRDKVSWS